MIIVTGDGRIIKDLDKAGVIRELQAAQKRGDRYCSVTGAIQVGLDPFDVEREAGYNIGATAKQCERSLDRSTRKYLSTIGQRGGKSGKGDAKKRGEMKKTIDNASGLCYIIYVSTRKAHGRDPGNQGTGLFIWG